MNFSHDRTNIRKVSVLYWKLEVGDDDEAKAMDVDDMTLFQEALHSAMRASGILGKVRAQLRFAALETLKGTGNAAKAAGAAGDLFGAHALDTNDEAVVLAHALVLDFLAGQQSLRLSAGIFEEEAGVERLPEALRTRDGVSQAAGLARTSREPVLVSMLRSSTQGGAAATKPAAAVSVRAETHVDPGHEAAHDAAGSDVAKTDNDDPEEEEEANDAVGPSFSVAAAARWTVPTRGAPRDGKSLECSDESVSTAAINDVADDWDEVEAVGSSSGGVTTSHSTAASSRALPSSQPPPPAAVVAPSAASAPMMTTHSDSEEGPVYEEEYEEDEF